MYRKIREAHSSLDNVRKDRVLPDKIRKLKLVQMELERKNSIVKENHRLHSQLTKKRRRNSVMSQQNSFRSSNSQQSWTPDFMQVQITSKPKSLNSTFKKQEGHRINLENRVSLKRTTLTLISF